MHEIEPCIFEGLGGGLVMHKKNRQVMLGSCPNL